MLYQKILNESRRLNQQISSMEHIIKSLPDGKLTCSRTGDRFKWYVSDGHSRKYLPKKFKEQAEQLAYKKYLSLKLDALHQELTALDFYLRHHPQSPDPADKLLIDHPEYQKLLSPYFQPVSQELSEWASAPFFKNPYHPEKLIHKTDAGIFVRSKSEAMIVHFLHINRIPFRYECALTLGNATVFPDFTIRHPQTGTYYYHEHFGRMDDPSYARKAADKLQLYIVNGIIPSLQLTTTYETLAQPLSYDKIASVFTEYFL